MFLAAIKLLTQHLKGRNISIREHLKFYYILFIIFYIKLLLYIYILYKFDFLEKIKILKKLFKYQTYLLKNS